MKTFLFLVILLYSSLSVAQPNKDTVASDAFIDVTVWPTMIDTLWKVIKYPDVALRSGIEGKVYLNLFISSIGTVDKVTVENRSDSLFIESAVTAIKKIRFSPALDDKHLPVGVWFSQTIQFRLPSH
jgi:TonB family protein